MNTRFRLVLLSLLLLVVVHRAVQGVEPGEVARWDFNTEASTEFVAHGAVLRDQLGPRPPEFPDFDIHNTAVRFDHPGAFLSVADPSANSRFDFTNGDSVTLDGWVNLDVVNGESPVYLIGKGRTGNPRVARDNQNWALRLVPSGEVTHLSFLFATEPTTGNAHWHRWTSSDGFHTASGWHHVAVGYRFGNPKSIRGWIDGKSSDGRWDMGGETIEPPIVDNDDIWIGSAHAGNSLVGSVDAVAIHRELLADDVIALRCRRIGDPSRVIPIPAVMPEVADIPSGRTLVTIAEGMPSADHWPNRAEDWPAESIRWTCDGFLLPRIPLRYDDWGIRDDWQAPVLLRLAADVELPPGNHRLLMRARGLGRLWIDGELIAETSPVSRKSLDGGQPITPIAQPPLPGLRAHGYHQQEVFGEKNVIGSGSGEAQPCRVVLELIVGGKSQRTETGEVCVAIQLENNDVQSLPTFIVLAPSLREMIPLTDEAITGALEQMETSLVANDDAARRRTAAAQDEFWDRRHEVANQWSTGQPVALPSSSLTTHKNAVDAFIASKIAKAVDAERSMDAKISGRFNNEVLPILQEHCFRCHGDKKKGGLKLDSREALLLAGDSELTAVVPGEAEASELIEQVRGGTMPPTGASLSEDQITTLEHWIDEGAAWPPPPVDAAQIVLSPAIDDASFLRRVYFDTVGVPPTLEQAQCFLSDADPEKRERLINDLLLDQRLADNWMGFWQDLLAENPTLLNQSLNSTGPFRWFLYESLCDNKAIDRMVTELIMMRGSADTGGSAGFGLAGENDAPFAAKGQILATAFLGVELKCARCHDAPYHSTLQRDLFSLAAMIERKPVSVPPSSRVPDAFFEEKGRDSLIKMTLKPNEIIDPIWPFATVTQTEDNQQLDPMLVDPHDTRERLAALITSPTNARFARVVVNRVWNRLMGAGLVEPVDDWEGRSPSHAALLDWLAKEFISNGFDMRHLMRQIMTSQAYQREADERSREVDPGARYFSAPVRRRLTAEQIVDALHAVTGNSIDSEELTFVHDGQRPLGQRQTLGKPKRAWMMASLNNERDRPSLSLPKARTVTDVMQAFGWSGSRQEPISEREDEANVLQPGILANGTLSATLTRVSKGSELAQQAIDADTPTALVDDMFLRILCRPPTDGERETFATALEKGFESRHTTCSSDSSQPTEPPLPLVTWFNHLQSEATAIQQELERRALAGPLADPRLDPTWRANFEDFVWSLINSREFVWLP